MAARRANRDGETDEDGRSFLVRLSFLLKVHCCQPKDRVTYIAQNGLTVEQVEAWRLEARRVLKYLPGLKGKPPK